MVKVPTVVVKLRTPTDNGQQSAHNSTPKTFNVAGVRPLPPETTPNQMEQKSVPSTFNNSSTVLPAHRKSWPVLIEQRLSAAESSISTSRLPQTPTSSTTNGFSTTPTNGFSTTPTNGFSTTPTNGFSTTPTNGFSTTPTQIVDETSERIRRNRELLFSRDERSIKTCVTVLENFYATWCPPKQLPRENLITTGQWDVRATCRMDKGSLHVRLTGPCNISRPFTIPFSNIFASSRSQTSAASWPPTEEMMAQCDDLSRWELDMCIDPYTDIKATVIDPWKKAYLLTIPVKLIKQKNKE